MQMIFILLAVHFKLNGGNYMLQVVLVVVPMLLFYIVSYTRLFQILFFCIKYYNSYTVCHKMPTATLRNVF